VRYIAASVEESGHEMRILVTGGAGYIGSVLVPILLDRGHEVTVLDTFSRGTTELAACCGFVTFNPFRGDARDERILDELVSRADVIIPLAALVGAPLCKEDPIAARTTNLDAVVALTKRTRKEQMVIFPTTNSGYGVGELGDHCTEATPLRPISLYGETKVGAEKAVLERSEGVTLRLATLFGMSPRMRIDLLVNDFTWRAVTDRAVVIFEGHFRRNYLHVRDAAKALEHAIANFGTMRGQAYNVGLSNANLSKIQLAAKIKEQVPNFEYLEAPIGEDPDKRDYIVSNEKIERTGWVPDWELEAGIAELVRGFRMLRNSRYANI
jgi:nucleoside-diphosphate-sugar epimerase